MRINELESQIAFQIKPLIQTQQQTIQFYKSRIQNINFHNNEASINSKNSNSKHSRTRSLNYSKKTKNLDCLSNTEKIKNLHLHTDYEEIYALSQEKMKKYAEMLKCVVENLNNNVNSYKMNQNFQKKDKEQQLKPHIKGRMLK